MRIKTCEYNYRRTRAKEILRGKKKRARHDNPVLTAEDRQRIEKLMKEGFFNNGENN